jgi:hypothetical protein
MSCAYAPGYIQTFISYTLFDLSNRKPSKNSTFVSCSVLTDFCQYLCLPLYLFLFEFFWSRNFWGSCYSSICFICGGFELKPEPKGLIYYHAYANVANRIVLSFVWRKFSSVGIGEWWDELKNGQKLKLGDAHAPQEISKRYKHQSLGMPPRHPLLHRQKSGHLSTHYIFIASCIMRFSWSVSCFLFSVFFLFVCCNKCLDHIMCLERDMLRFSFAENTPFFTLIISTSVLFF